MKNFPQLPAGSRFVASNMISGVKDGHDAFLKWNDFMRSITDDSLHSQSGGVGFDGVTDVVHKVSIVRNGDLIKTEIYLDITGLNSKNTDGDIIGDDGTGEAWFAQITDAVNGAVYKGRMNCIELPATGDPNIALWSAVEATGVEDTLITLLDETELLQSQGDGTDWAAGDEVAIAVTPPADEYLYLVQGDATGTTGTYTAGIFLIELWGITV